MKDFSMIKKLKIGITALVLLATISSIINYLAFTKVQSAYDEFKLLNETNKNLNNFLNLITNNTLGYMDAIVDKDSGDVDEGIVKKHLEFMEWFNVNKASIIKEVIHINKDFNGDDFIVRINKYLTAGDGMIKDIKNKKTDDLGKYDDDIDGINESIGLDIAKNLELSNKLFLVASKEVEDAQKLISSCTIISFFGMIIFGFSIAYYIIKSISTTLDQSGSKLNLGAETVLKSSRDFSNLGIKLY